MTESRFIWERDKVFDWREWKEAKDWFNKFKRKDNQCFGTGMCNDTYLFDFVKRKKGKSKISVKEFTDEWNKFADGTFEEKIDNKWIGYVKEIKTDKDIPEENPTGLTGEKMLFDLIKHNFPFAMRKTK